MKSLSIKVLGCAMIALLCISSTSYGVGRPGGGKSLMGPGLYRLECPEWFIDLDQAGYSDWWWLKPDPLWHCVPMEHEVLSGEWAAAIYYDGVENSGDDPTAPAGTAVWLTDSFVFPSWDTNSSFATVSVLAWDDAANPSDAGTGDNDTAKTVITNGQVTITIDYEIADLGQVFASPLGVVPDPATGAFALSSRYVLLQTYTILNVSGEPLDNMEFYQMLHTNPADEFGPAVTSVYDSDLYPDPLLAGYAPLNAVHTVGNFRYDITQWNSPGAQGAMANWVDWVGFSCTVPPTAVGNNFFRGHAAKPAAPGTHWDIEARALNGLTVIPAPPGTDEVAGAEMWAIGTLENNTSHKITVVLMTGQMDCNENGIPDICDIDGGESEDTNANGIPDECESEAIPAVTEWGMILMTLLVVTAGVVVIRKRRLPV